jgi:hypothetical protein
VAATADGKREGSEKPMQEERTHAKNKTKTKFNLFIRSHGNFFKIKLYSQQLLTNEKNLLVYLF